MINTAKQVLISAIPFPPIAWWQMVLSHSSTIDVAAHYQKMTYRNRYEIGAANGRLLLSIPLENGRNQRIAMKDVRISYQENWQDKHWKSIQSAYKRTPFFEFYDYKIQALFTDKIELLTDWNLKSIQIVFDILNINNEMTISESFINAPKNEVLDWRNYSPKTNVEMILGKYIQPFEQKNGFLENLSIIDLICCEGPNAIQFLK